MTLQEIRTKWEQHKEVELKVVKQLPCGYTTVYVILSDGIRRCWLHRYFQLEDGWQVSVDIDDGIGIEGLRKCFDTINAAFGEVTPV